MIRAAILIAVVVAAAAFAQAPAFRARTDGVAMYVTVLDENDTPVSGLRQAAFTVAEDGQERPVEQFANVPVPLSLVLAVDASESMKGARFVVARQAVATFFRLMGPDDEIGVIGFNDRPFLIASWSRSIDVVNASLDRVEPKGTTALYDAVSDALDALRGSRNRRRAVVIISDGNDFRLSDLKKGPAEYPPPAFVRAIPVLERLRRSEAQVYAVGVDAWQESTARDKTFDANALRRLTNPTGGLTIVVRANDAVLVAADRIAEALQSQYLIGFAPAHPADGRFHSVRVTVRGCRCRVLTREGFVADKATRP